MVVLSRCEEFRFFFSFVHGTVIIASGWIIKVTSSVLSVNFIEEVLLTLHSMLDPTSREIDYRYADCFFGLIVA